MKRRLVKLSALLQRPIHPDPEISSVHSDSRSVTPGALFAALAGVKTDGAKFVAMAMDKGAAAVLCHPSSRAAIPDGVSAVLDVNPRSRLAQIAARFYGAHPATIAAVTGTNGKTSVANFVRQIWAHGGLRAASLGTVGAMTPQGLLELKHTTPDPVVLHEMLARIAGMGVTHAALEASSHGLDQNRLDGLRVQAAGFTNLSRDHLDYHPSFEDYRHAKFRLFAEVLAPGGTAVVNAESGEAEALSALAQARGHRVMRVGTADADLALLQRAPTGQGQNLRLRYEGRTYDVALPLAGAFQASNILVAAGLALATGAAADSVFTALRTIEGAPGRLERVGSHPNGAAIYVDYAHTPDAIETAIAALRPHTKGRLVIAIGCGGDRDPGKRPLMGTAASKADFVIVTDDNPRSEDPAAIRKAAMAGVTAHHKEIGDRAEAIRAGIKSLGAGDVFIVAGKGHETGQTIGGVTHHFNDAEEVRAALGELGGTA
jgi:UDP-N-acetylmuramoyl-L-alanyl-D-glutamate--2,6-diaminopimelate ligase